jgi:hypothetical protein
MCSGGPRSLDGQDYIPVTFNVTVEEYLMLLKKKNGKTWNELFLGNKEVKDDEKK